MTVRRMYGTNQNCVNFFNAGSLNDDLRGMRTFETAMEIAERNPKTYKIIRHSGGATIVRETADCIRKAGYNFCNPCVSYIKHIDKKTGKEQMINTFGDYINNYNFFKSINKQKVKHFATFGELLKHFRKKQNKSFKFLNMLKNIFKL